MSSTILTPQRNLPVGSLRSEMYGDAWYLNKLPITLHPFTITVVNVTPAVAHVGGRPGLTLAGAGAATDGANYSQAVGSHRIVAGKRMRIFFSVYSADATNHEWWFGLAVHSTTQMANLSGGTAPTDHLTVSKVKTATVPSLRCRKASGTQEAVALNLTQADATWYDYEVVVEPDATTASRGRVRIFVSTAGATPVLVLDTTIGAQLPDTVSLSAGFGFLEGDTGTDATTFGHYEIARAY